MSNRATEWAFAADVRGSAKAVLVALADRANDQNVCWPSVADLVKRTGLSERTVQRSLIALRERACFTVEGKNGTLPRYTLAVGSAIAPAEPPSGSHPRQDDTPDNVAGTPVTLAPTPVTVTPDPRHSDTRTVKNHQEPSENQGDAPSRAEPRGSRLADDWQPSAEDRRFARSLGLNADAVADRFRDYWHAASGASARKTNWSATWRNWCRKDAERAGQRGGGAAPRPSSFDALNRFRASRGEDPVEFTLQ